MKPSEWTCIAIAVLGLDSAVLAVNVRADDDFKLRLDSDYASLLEETEDKDALEAIRVLHMQLNGDKNDDIESLGTGNNFTEISKLHLTNSELRMSELWREWKTSKDSSSEIKDVFLSSLLVLAVTGLFYAYKLNQTHQEHLQRMLNDMDSLSKSEQDLHELQEKLQRKDSTSARLAMLPPSELLVSAEAARLRQEIEVLRSELRRAEIELEDRCWLASPALQHWLRLTYEMESAVCNAKKQAAEEQLKQAKEMCERLKRKRSSLVSAFVSTHCRSVDEVDRSILEAKAALLEVTRDLTERTQRWHEIEALCGVPIFANHRMGDLQDLVCPVGAKSDPSRVFADFSSGMSCNASQDNLLQDDIELVSHLSFRGPSRRRIEGSGAPFISSDCSNRQMCGESGIDSSRFLDDQTYFPHITDTGIQMAFPPSPLLPDRHLQQRMVPRSSTPSAMNSSLAAKRARMIKSYSQDGADSPHRQLGSRQAGGLAGGSTASLKSVMSEGRLQKEILPLNRTASAESSNSSSLNFSESSLAESESASDLSSAKELNVRKKKKLPFFTYKLRREKLEI